MARNLGLQKIPSLNPDAEEGEEISTFDRSVLRVINSNFELINVAMSGVQVAQDLLENNVFGGFTGEWVPYTTTVLQPTAVTISSQDCKYFTVGNLVVFQFHIFLSGTGTAANGVLIQTPSNMVQSVGYNTPRGNGFIYDASAVHLYEGTWFSPGSTGNKLSLFCEGNAGAWGALPSIALANTDQCAGVVVYESV